MEKVKLQVNGMTCGHCVNSVEESVGKLQGVSNVKVHLENGMVEIEYNADELGVDAIKKTIDDQGYEVK